MSMITRSFGKKNEFILYEGGYTKAQAQRRAKQLRAKYGVGIRVSPYEGQWAIWMKRKR